ncbi:MAG: methyltransferase domain-containing protein [Ferruginibacter sp.]
MHTNIQSMDIDNQHHYWNSVAAQKTFTHPIDTSFLLQYVDKGAAIVDYGCGYGRIVQELLHSGFSNIKGFDTSTELISRGIQHHLPIHHISTPSQIPVGDNSVDCFILFALLTCIPSNEGQYRLIDLLHTKLKPGGFIYISDYYLQDNKVAKSRYTYLNNDIDNFGVFSLSEGVTFRHHAKEWIVTLLKNFSVQREVIIEVKTMNGNSAPAFQMMLQKLPCSLA